METLRWRARAEEAAGIYRSASHYYKIGGMNDDVLMCLCDEREKGGGPLVKGGAAHFVCFYGWRRARVCQGECRDAGQCALPSCWPLGAAVRFGRVRMARESWQQSAESRDLCA